jgi:hypothetical protein
MDASRIAMSVVSMPYPDFSHTIPVLPHHPNKQGFFLLGTSLLFIPF